MHWDFRLEVDGVLVSWAVPRGPSLNPKDKRMAAHVEDHPFDYGGFEGVIPKGNYGAGQVIVWDNGTYSPDEKRRLLVGRQGRGQRAHARGDWRRAKLSFTLRGKKLHGSWTLVRTATRPEGLAADQASRRVRLDARRAAKKTARCSAASRSRT